MTDRHDPLDVDIENALDRYLTEHRMTRRELLERIGPVGAVAALAPIVAACTGGAASAARRRRRRRRRRPRRPRRAAVGRGRDRDPRADPGPVARVRAGRLQLARLHRRGRHPLVRGEVPGQGQVRASSTTSRSPTPSSATDGSGYDISFPISVDVPRFVDAGTIIAARPVADPEPRQPRRRVGEPGLRPGQRPLGAVHVVDDRRRLRHDEGQGHADELEGALGRALQGPHLDDGRLPGGLRRWRSSSSAIRPTRPTRPSSTRPSRCSRQQKPLLRTYSNDTISDDARGDVWIGHDLGLGPVRRSSEENENIAYYIPEEGGVRGSDTAVDLLGRQAPVAAHLFINHLLDAQVSASNTNFIGYMGPNEAAKEFIDPAILPTRRSTPTRRSSTSSRSCSTCRTRVDEEYLSRWQALKAGGCTSTGARPAASVGDAEPRTRHDRRAARDRLAGDLLPGPAGVHPGRQPRDARRARADRPRRPVARQLPQGVQPGLPADADQRAALRGADDRRLAADRLSRSPTGSRATAATARPCCWSS